MSDVSSEPLGDTFKYNPEYNRMADFLGLDIHARQDYGLAQKISLIRDWAGLKGKDDSATSAMTTLQRLKRDLGTNVQGKELINEFYQHIRLDMDRNREKVVAKDQKKEPLREKPIVKKSPGGTDIKKMVAGAVSQSVKGMVQNVLKDKKIMEGAITSAIKESFNGK